MGMKSKSQDKFVDDVFKIVGDEYSVIGEYKHSRFKVKMRHNVCGYEFEVEANSFLHRRGGCLRCSSKEKKDTFTYVNEVYSLVGDEYTVLGEYITNRVKILMKHNICGHEYHIVPTSFLSGRRCPNCNKWSPKNIDTFKDRVKSLVGDEYIVLGQYIKSNVKIKVKHIFCGHEYEVTPSRFLNGRRCPKCNESKGERKIRDFLNANNIVYVTEYKNNLCKNTRLLRFDFGVYDDKDEIMCLIEFDGKQHFQSVASWGGDEQFKRVNKNDKTKNMFCQENNIPLIRIPYWEFDNIENILTSELNKLGLEVKLTA